MPSPAIVPHRGQAGLALLASIALLTACSPAPDTRPRAAAGQRPSATRRAAAARPQVPDVLSRPQPFRLAEDAAAGRPPAARTGIDLVSAVAAAQEPGPLPASGQSASQSAAQVAEIRDMLAGYLRAFNRHDAAAAAEHWAATGENVNLDSGEVTRGREAVREVFAALFESDAEATIDIDVASIRPLRDEVAVVDGVSRVSYADGEAAGSRFSAVVVREQGDWRLASVREAPCPAPARPTRPLEELAWLVGSWEDAGAAGVAASGHCEWSGDGTYLTRRHVVSPAATGGEPPAAGDRIPALLPAAGTARRELTEIIAWDPERESIRSWIFCSDGRFAEGTWSRDGEAWVVRVEGRGLDSGREATCTLTADGRDGLVVRTEGEHLSGLMPPACGYSRTSRESRFRLTGPTPR